MARGRRPIPKPQRKPEPKPKPGRSPIPASFFELSPQALRVYLLVKEHLERSHWEEPDSDEEPRSLLEAYMATLQESFAFPKEPTLTLGAVYPIRICKAADKWRCRFDPPPWFSKPGARHPLTRLSVFLSATARWFEENKQEFLQNPSPENYAHGEAKRRDFPMNPIITQQGLLARINGEIPNKDYHLDETAFARLCDKIWLLWPDQNMPLKNVFLKAFRKAWVKEWVEVSELSIADFSSLLKEISGWDKGEKGRIRQKSFDNMTQGEKLYYLCAIAKVNVQSFQNSLEEEGDGE